MSGAAWSVEWVAITWCTGDVREEVRRMEEAMYPASTRRLEGRRRLRAAGRAQGCSAAAGEARTGETAAVAMMGRTARE